MFEVKVMNVNTKKIFTREFNYRRIALNFARKVKFSKVLALLSFTDNSKYCD